jgi:Tol biopolymer transport system component
MSRIPPQEEKAAPNGSASSERLDSWKEIARYLNRDVRTVQRWEETDGLPIYRRAEGRKKGSPVYAFASEIDAWLRKNPPSRENQESRPMPEITSGKNRVRFAWTAVGFLVLLVGGVATWRIVSKQNPVPSFRVVSLTTYPGIERHPAFSPDGKQVAFSWNGPQQNNYDLYVKFLDGGEPTRLTTHPGVDGWPMWSPDGHFIAFARWVLGGPTGEVLIIPALGGAERKVSEFPIPFKPSEYWPGGCWTPDGRSIVLPTAGESLGLLSLQTLEVKRLWGPEKIAARDCCPAISPDGRNLAFLRASRGASYNLYVQPLGTDYGPIGQPIQLTAEAGGVLNPMWTGNGKEVLYITSREGERSLWRIPYDRSRSASQIESLGQIGYYWAISPRGNQLAYSNNQTDRDIWRINLTEKKDVSRIVSSSVGDINPQFSPDGKRIAFVSGREKGWRLWVAGSDGTHPVDLAPIAESRPGPARWSPDGKEVVFECQDESNADICAVQSNGGTVRRLTRNPARDSLPSWSRDGKWIYITSNRSGTFQIWKVPSDGTEVGAIQLTRGGGFASVESADGRTVYFARTQLSSSIWRVAAGGGEEIRVGSFSVFQCYTFALSNEGIYYTSSDTPERWFDLMMYRFSGSKSERISRINKRLWSGLSVSPDEQWLLFTASDGGSTDLSMVENFR